MTTMKTVATTRRHLCAAQCLIGALALILWTSGCATTGMSTEPAGSPAPRLDKGMGNLRSQQPIDPQANPVPFASRALLRERWGIEVASLHLSAYGRMVDFRYRGLDPDKAALLGDRNVKPSLIDLATGAVLRVPSFPKTGSMRQTSTKMEAGRIYFMLFANTGMPVKNGSQVTITIGDFKAENLTVM